MMATTLGFSYNITMNNKDRETIEPFLMSILNDFVTDSYASEELKKHNLRYVIKAIELLQVFNIKTLDEIQLYIKERISEDKSSYFELNEWIQSGSSTKGTQNFYSETTSESFMSTGLDDGGIPESMGE
tara:strand:+ start:1124 stop:1510 length:387 start_codon:yes stop_codon:yes gene_type:complete